MNINTTNESGNPLTGFQTTDGGYVYRRVTPIELHSGDPSSAVVATPNGLITLEERATVDKSGDTKLLIRIKVPYYSMAETKCCGSETTSYDVVPAGSIVSHMVLTLNKKVVRDLQGSNAALAANQILAAVGMNLGLGNLVDSSTGNPLANFVDGKLVVSASDPLNALSPTRALTRAIMGVTPLPPEGFVMTDASWLVRSMES